MGRHDFRPLRSLDSVSRLFKTKSTKQAPSWYQVLSDHPPSQALLRQPPVQHTLSSHGQTRQRPNKKKRSSKMFMPQLIQYPEDSLRQQFYKDHPWELARPRVLMETDGTDHRKWDWSMAHQQGRPVNGESVIQRQHWFMTIGPLNAEGKNVPLGKIAAYDKARKELYEVRHREEIERRVAREEAQSTGAKFGLSSLDVGTQLENEEFEKWKVWARAKANYSLQSLSAKSGGGEDIKRDPRSGSREDFSQALDELQEPKREDEDGGEELAEG